MARRGGLFALLIGLLAGAATGVLFAPTKGKTFRTKMKKEIKEGGYGQDSLYRHFSDMAKDIKKTAGDAYEGSRLDEHLSKHVDKAKEVGKKHHTRAKAGLSKAKTRAKKSADIAKKAAKDIKSEIVESKEEE